MRLTKSQSVRVYAALRDTSKDGGLYVLVTAGGRWVSAVDGDGEPFLLYEGAMNALDGCLAHWERYDLECYPKYLGEKEDMGGRLVPDRVHPE